MSAVFMTVPVLSGDLRKNDALFLYGATQPLPFVCAYEQQAVEVVHGPSCTHPEREIEVDRCRTDGVPVIARRGGGGTVVLSPGMVVTVVVGVRPAGEIRAIYARIQGAMCGLIGSVAGVKIVQAGISDLTVEQRKVGGSSLYLPARPNLYFYQSSLMVASDTALIARYLKHPPREPEYRAHRSHAEFCATLRELGYPRSAGETAALFSDRLGEFVEAEILKDGAVAGV